MVLYSTLDALAMSNTLVGSLFRQPSTASLPRESGRVRANASPRRLEYISEDWMRTGLAHGKSSPRVRVVWCC
jgi:hypothetical protein